MKSSLNSFPFLLVAIILQSCVANRNSLPSGFQYVKDVIPDITLEMRYYGYNNFIGRPIRNYEANTAILSTKAVETLIKVEDELNANGQGLKIFDSYRPQSAVNHFIKWAKVKKDTMMKSQYYPNIEKSNLFDLGYIAERSGHTRGSTIDLTIISLKTGKDLDMGSPYDFFGNISHHTYQNITKEQTNNRQYLKSIMQKHGFIAYSEEWWHYTLEDEPFPDTYFDFPVK